VTAIYTRTILEQCESVVPGWSRDNRDLRLQRNGHTLRAKIPFFKGDRIVRLTITPRFGEGEGSVWTRNINRSGVITGPGGFTDHQVHCLDSLLAMLRDAVAWIDTQSNPEGDSHCLGARFWSDE